MYCQNLFRDLVEMSFSFMTSHYLAERCASWPPSCHGHTQLEGPPEVVCRLYHCSISRTVKSHRFPPASGSFCCCTSQKGELADPVTAHLLDFVWVDDLLLAEDTNGSLFNAKHTCLHRNWTQNWSPRQAITFLTGSVTTSQPVVGHVLLWFRKVCPGLLWCLQKALLPIMWYTAVHNT